MVRLGFVVALGMGIGCGPAVGTTGGGEGSEGSGGDATSGAGTGSGTGTADGTGSTTSADACEAVHDVPGGDPMQISIRNATDTTLFVGLGGCDLIPFSASRTDDGSAVRWLRGSCVIGCEDVLADQCFECGACLGESLLRIGPGASYPFTWDGATYHETEIPGACLAAPCQASCPRREPAETGAQYHLVVQATQTCIGDGCTCTDGASSCEVIAEGFGEPYVIGNADVVYPAASVEVVLAK